MSDKKLDDLRRKQAEEDFFRMAAQEIDAEENEAFWQAQQLPDPPPEVMERLQKGLQAEMNRAARKRRTRRVWKHVGQAAACIAIVGAVALTGTYVNVEAARKAINNFFLDYFDGNAVMRTDETQDASGVGMPDDWSGPFAVLWVPERFTAVSAKSNDGNWMLFYDDESSDSDLSMFVWNASTAPYIDVERMDFISESTIDDALVNIYYKEDEDVYMLLWTSDNYVVQIMGAATPEELEKIAENISF
ncbi:MAG TPA: DUF4367 domain-containing protein [Candidatus Gemmiger faecigallinarum]|nr:DUF4367 domain-containing protein [Candidatus Gemmiger faecigallinarum]